MFGSGPCCWKDGFYLAMIVLHAIVANQSYIMYRECQRILHGSAIYVCCSDEAYCGDIEHYKLTDDTRLCTRQVEVRACTDIKKD